MAVKNMAKPDSALDLNDYQEKSDFDKKTPNHKAKAICVVLEEDTAKRDLTAVMAAIAQLKGVAVVKFVDLDAFHNYPNRTRAKMEIRAKIDTLLDL